MSSRSVSELHRIIRASRTLLISESDPCIGHKRVAVMQTTPLACDPAVVLPVLFVSELAPWSCQISHIAPVKGSRSIPPAGLQKRWKHLRNTLPGALPGHIGGPVI